MSCKRTEEATLAHFMGHFVSFLTSKVRKMSKTMAHISPVAASVKCQKTSYKLSIFGWSDSDILPKKFIFPQLSRPSKYLDKMP